MLIPKCQTVEYVTGSLRPEKYSRDSRGFRNELPLKENLFSFDWTLGTRGLWKVFHFCPSENSVL